jgi:hypothetical protein
MLRSLSGFCDCANIVFLPAFKSLKTTSTYVAELTLKGEQRVSLKNRCAGLGNRSLTLSQDVVAGKRPQEFYQIVNLSIRQLQWEHPLVQV